MSQVGRTGSTGTVGQGGINIVAPSRETLPQGTRTRLLPWNPVQQVHAAAGTSQGAQSTAVAAHVEYHAAGLSTQRSQSTSVAGRIVYHAAGVTSQAAQAASGAGHVAYHAAGVTAQGAQSTQGVGREVFHASILTTQAGQIAAANGRLVFHANAGSVQGAQAAQGVGRVVYHAAGSTTQGAASLLALGHVLPPPPMFHITGGTAQLGQLTAAFGEVANPPPPDHAGVGGNVAAFRTVRWTEPFKVPRLRIRSKGSTKRRKQETGHTSPAPIAFAKPQVPSRRGTMVTRQGGQLSIISVRLDRPEPQAQATPDDDLAVIFSLAA